MGVAVQVEGRPVQELSPKRAGRTQSAARGLAGLPWPAPTPREGTLTTARGLQRPLTLRRGRAPPCVPAPEGLLGAAQHLPVLCGHEEEPSTPRARCLPGGVVTCRAGPEPHPAGPLRPQSPARAGALSPELGSGKGAASEGDPVNLHVAREPGSAHAVWKEAPARQPARGRGERSLARLGRAGPRPRLLQLALASEGQWQVAAL